MKEFKVAHIVPVSQLENTASNQYHMCLAHLVSNDAYAEFYKRMSAEGKYVLMDNGAAEGSQLGFDDLLAMYSKINPTEIVLPDTLYEAGSTIQKMREFLTYIGNDHPWKVMAVPQGKDIDEWEACARIMIKDTRIDTIGISKFLNIATNDRAARVKACNFVGKMIEKYNRCDLEVHLLGCDEGPVIVNVCHDLFGFVRGCDSAFGYLQAQARVLLTSKCDMRPKGQIDFVNGISYTDYDKYAHNFNALAGVMSNGVSEGWQA